MFTDEGFNKDLKLLPPECRSLIDKCPKERLVIDYISGMMDSFAIQQFIQYFGVSEYEKAYNKPFNADSLSLANHSSSSLNL